MEPEVIGEIEELARELIIHLHSTSSNDRFILGIAGIPGAGKSTTAESLVQRVNELSPARETAVVVPMDGFHLDNAALQEMGILELKGIPASFDAEGFHSLMRKIRLELKSPISAPLFDRSIEASIDGGVTIKPENRLCVVEGNYILLQERPWLDARKFFDQVWFLDVSFNEVYPRLLERHLAARSKAGAEAKIESTDLPNARLILETARHADRILRLSLN